jgi:hypothetical protein
MSKRSIEITGGRGQECKISWAVTFATDDRIGHHSRFEQMARMLDYRNVNKGSRCILRLEREGAISATLLLKLAEALAIDLPPRLMPAVYARRALPAEVTTHEQAEAWACEYARQQRLRVCLVLSRRHSVWIDALGVVESRTESTPGERNTPWMKLQGNKRKFLFGMKEGHD